MAYAYVIRVLLAGGNPLPRGNDRERANWRTHLPSIGTTVVEKIVIGNDCYIGAGATVVKSSARCSCLWGSGKDREAIEILKADPVMGYYVLMQLTIQ